jgi:hypothetical protein
MSFASTITPDEIEQVAREKTLATIRQTIPDDLLYEVVDGQIVEKVRETQLMKFRRNFTNTSPPV